MPECAGPTWHNLLGFFSASASTYIRVSTVTWLRLCGRPPVFFFSSLRPEDTRILHETVSKAAGYRIMLEKSIQHFSFINGLSRNETKIFIHYKVNNMYNAAQKILTGLKEWSSGVKPVIERLYFPFARKCTFFVFCSIISTLLSCVQKY